MDQLTAHILGELDTQWGPDGWGYTAVGDYASYSWYDNTTTGVEFWAGEDRDEDWTGHIQINF